MATTNVSVSPSLAHSDTERCASKGNQEHYPNDQIPAATEPPRFLDQGIRGGTFARGWPGVPVVNLRCHRSVSMMAISSSWRYPWRLASFTNSFALAIERGAFQGGPDDGDAPPPTELQDALFPQCV